VSQFCKSFGGRGVNVHVMQVQDEGVRGRKCSQSVESAGKFSVSIANGRGRNDPASPGDTSSLPQAKIP